MLINESLLYTEIRNRIVCVYMFLLPPEGGVCLHVNGGRVRGGDIVTGGGPGPGCETGTELI